jgi:hypothetical protein
MDATLSSSLQIRTLDSLLRSIESLEHEVVCAWAEVRQYEAEMDHFEKQTRTYKKELGVLQCKHSLSTLEFF